jgi:hypothetical protein
MKKFVSFVALVFSITFLLSNTTASFANDIPMTIDGVINCAHPDNAITTTCRGEAPPPPVNTPPLPTTISTPAPTPSVSVEPAAPQIPLTIDGVINCAHPDNSITTTCWDLAQAAKQSGSATSTPQLDCNLEMYKNYPVCTGIAPQAVIDLEKSKASAVPLPQAVNCADPMLMQTGACTNRTTTDLPADCALSENSNLPRCQPMTLPDGSINCAQPDNAVTTTCWEQSAALKSFGATTAINCALPGYSAYPACTGVKPFAVLEYEKSSNTVLPTIETVSAQIKIETITAIAPIAEQILEEVKVVGSVSLKTRSAKATVLTLDIDASKVKVQVVATKKGSKTLTQTVSTDIDGNRSVKFNKDLKGFTIKIIVDGQTLDTIKVK